MGNNLAAYRLNPATYVASLNAMIRVLQTTSVLRRLAEKENTGVGCSGKYGEVHIGSRMRTSKKVHFAPYFSYMKYLFLLPFLLFLVACSNPTKNTDAAVTVETGTELSATNSPPTTSSASATPPTSTAAPADENEEFLGSWVGYFRKDTKNEGEFDERTVFVDEGFIWNRENKINLSIDQIIGDSVIGHSVVAGNDRPCYGRMGRDRIADPMTFVLREPGDDKYDGVFRFYIEAGELVGTWEAYRDLSVKHRRYKLEKKTFSYNPNQELEQANVFVDWTKKVETKIEEDFGDGEFYEWMQAEYASATPAIYDINASNRLLTKAEVENLKKGDLTIIRNTIYARHGYSFKNRPLRVFFDAQPWYIPIHTDIRSDFTELEKKNIKLLLTYEKNAAEYYDSFGRG